MRSELVLLATAFNFACSPAPPQQPATVSPIVAAARAQIGVTTMYSPAYIALKYPGGDVPISKGVCTDVIIRALRTSHGIDLQKEIFLDKSANQRAYGGKPDRNIDHRRVKDQIVFLQRKGKAIQPQATIQAGDFVTWVLESGRLHIGVVSDKKSRNGTPLIIHNINRGVVEEDVLNAWKRTGAYRW